MVAIADHPYLLSTHCNTPRSAVQPDVAHHRNIHTNDPATIGGGHEHGSTRRPTPGVLRVWGKTVFERRDGQMVAIVVGQRRAAP